MSAASRMVIDSLRTVCIWAFSLSVHAADPTSDRGQAFSALELGGFAVLISGTLIYNKVYEPPCTRRSAAIAEPLLAEPPPLPERGRPSGSGPAVQADSVVVLPT